MSVHAITNNAPNEDTVSHLRKLLARAESGELRTVITVCGWSEDSWTHGWVMDSRSSRRRMLGEVSLTQYDMLTNVALMDGDTILANAL